MKYYISSLGNDANDGTSELTAWRTINKINSFQTGSTFKAGDSILFRGGDTFYGNFILGKSGTSTNHIFISSYGVGKAVITGMSNLNFTDQNNNLWSAPLNAPLPFNLVTKDGLPLAQGRWPKTGYNTVKTHNTNLSITDNALSGMNWQGAELVIKPQRWLINRHKITSQSGNTLYYIGTSNARDHWGYFIQNHIKTLTQNGDWFYNTSTKQLMMYSDVEPTGIQAATLNTILTSSSKSYIDISNISFIGANGTLANISGGNQITMDEVDILNAGITGLNNTSSNSKFTNCNIQNCLDKAVNQGGGNGFFQSNNIKDIAMIAGAGGSGDGHYFAVSIGGSTTWQNNSMENMGYLGVYYSGNNVKMYNNTMINWCYLKDDSGPFYTRGTPGVTNYGREIIGNICTTNVPATEGCNSTKGSSDGMYFDDNANGVLCSGNVLKNTGAAIRGIFVHNANNIVIKDNTVQGFLLAQISYSHDNLGGIIRGIVQTGNTLIAETKTQLVMLIYTYPSSVDDTGEFGIFDYNHYCRPSAPLKYLKVVPSGTAGTYYELPTWRAKYGYDTHSDTTPPS